jgi:hypothetical protein
LQVEAYVTSLYLNFLHYEYCKSCAHSELKTPVAVAIDLNVCNACYFVKFNIRTDGLFQKKISVADGNNTVFKNLHATCYFVKVYQILIKRDELDKPSAHASFLATSYPGRARIKTLEYMGGMVKRNKTFSLQVCLALLSVPYRWQKIVFIFHEDQERL